MSNTSATDTEIIRFEFLFLRCFLNIENLDYLNFHPREKAMKSDGISGQFSCPTSLPKGKDFFRRPHNQHGTVLKSFAERATSHRISCNE